MRYKGMGGNVPGLLRAALSRLFRHGCLLLVPPAWRVDGDYEIHVIQFKKS